MTSINASVSKISLFFPDAEGKWPSENDLPRLRCLLSINKVRVIEHIIRGPGRPLLLQTLILTVACFLLFFRFYGLTDVVTINYYRGGTAFVNGLDPYEFTARQGTANQFKYSPLLAVVMGELARANKSFPIDGLWIFGSFGLFFFGLSRWINFAGKLRSIVILALLSTIVDTFVCLSVKQINIWIVSLLLIGLAEYRDKRHFNAGALLMLATNFKVYPLLFLLAFLVPFSPAYLLGALSAGIVAFLLPTLWVGWSHNLQMHIVWIRLVLTESTGNGALDVFSAFKRIGLSGLGQLIRIVILLATIVLFLPYPALVKRINWVPWITLGVASILLLSPRTEVFTYVLLAPSYVLMVDWAQESRHEKLKRYGPPIFFILGILIAMCAYIDPHWMTSESPLQVFRVIGALGFWFATGAILFNEYRQTFVARRSVQK